MNSRNFRFDINDLQRLMDVSDGLASKYRLQILLLLSKRSRSIQEILKEVDISPSTLSFHLKVLKEAKLIKYVSNPSSRGNEKNVSLNVDTIHINFMQDVTDNSQNIYGTIPIGSFANFDITAPCLIVDDKGIINPIDNSIVFKSYQRINASLISFEKGTLEYNLIYNELIGSKVEEISFSQEICSECPDYNNTWKSTITFWINDIEIGSYLSLGDFGGRKGNFTPDWWPIKSSNYGVMVKVSVNNKGTFINGKMVSGVKISDLKLNDNPIIKYKLGVKENSQYVGGLNLFGKKFGDYDQDISVSITYKE